MDGEITRYETDKEEWSMNLREWEKVIRELKQKCPNPIIRIECSPTFYRNLKLKIKETSDDSVGRINSLGYGDYLNIPIIIVPFLPMPFRLVYANDILEKACGIPNFIPPKTL